ncbi:hypothetical protein Bca52824_017354 [Brassica carinata]|uniref:Uncharacterized protein n=1 Tax=Brassica carinata TaxID=52824 RepID=A0A8X8AY77_BRACI|nr:hypothetical protein Bca52824_017354 [Brassica carinata]
MAGRTDLKLKRPLEDEYGSTPKEAFKAISAKLELLKKLIPSYAMKLDKETLESEQRLAEVRMADVKVPTIDWIKLGEPYMYED